MNCDDFKKIIHELADYKPMQATIRDASVSHIALCAACAAKLANARALGTGLVLAASAESEEAPVRIKENLLASFNALQQKVPDNVVDISHLNRSVVDISRGRKLRWWTAAAVAIAAVILLAVILPNWKGTIGPGSQLPSTDLKAGLVQPSQTPVTGDDKPIAFTDPGKAGTPSKPAAGKRRLMKHQRRPEAGSTKALYETVAQNTGEYLPLTYLATSTAIDSGTIVRVQLSRSALAGLGLPINFEGTGASVKADVVLGDDGVARAIRLVQ